MIGIGHKYRFSSNKSTKQLAMALCKFLCAVIFIWELFYAHLQAETLTQIDIKKQKSVYHVKTQAHYEHSSNKVWDVLKDYTSLRYLIPRVKTSRVIWQKDNSAEVKIVIDAPWPWRDVWTHVVIEQDPQTQSFKWKQKKGRLKSFIGKAWLEDAEQDKKNSLFFTDFRINMGRSIPKFVQSWVLNHYIPKILKKLPHKIKA